MLKSTLGPVKTLFACGLTFFSLPFLSFSMNPEDIAEESSIEKESEVSDVTLEKDKEGFVLTNKEGRSIRYDYEPSPCLTVDADHIEVIETISRNFYCVKIPYWSIASYLKNLKQKPKTITVPMSLTNKNGEEIEREVLYIINEDRSLSPSIEKIHYVVFDFQNNLKFKVDSPTFNPQGQLIFDHSMFIPNFDGGVPEEWKIEKQYLKDAKAQLFVHEDQTFYIRRAQRKNNKPIISLHKVTLEGETAMNLGAQLESGCFEAEEIELHNIINRDNSFYRDDYLHFNIVPSFHTKSDHCFCIRLDDIKNSPQSEVFKYHNSILIDLGPHVKIDFSNVYFLGDDVSKEWICNEVSYIVMASENEPERHEKKYVYFNTKSNVKIVTPQAPHFVQQEVFEFDPKGLCIEFYEPKLAIKNGFYMDTNGYLLDNRRAKEKVHFVDYLKNDQYPYFEKREKIMKAYLRYKALNVGLELGQIKILLKLNKNGCQLTSSYLDALNVLNERRNQINRVKELGTREKLYFSEQGESKKFVGNGIYNIEKKDIRNIYRSDYVPFFMLPANKYSHTLAIMHLSDAELSLLEVTPYDLEKVVVAVEYGHDLKPNSIYLINRDPLDKGDVVKLELNNETSEDKDKISIKINRNSLSGKIYVPVSSDLSLADLKEKAFDLNVNIFETIKASRCLDAKPNELDSSSIQKILTPFIGTLTDKLMGEFTEEENFFVKKIINPVVFNLLKREKTRSLSQMSELAYDECTFTNKFIETLRKRKDFPFTNPQSTIGAFVKIAKSMENHRWCLDLKTGELRIDSSAVPNNPNANQ